jgi:hypothetical protein
MRHHGVEILIDETFKAGAIAIDRDGPDGRTLCRQHR